MDRVVRKSRKTCGLSSTRTVRSLRNQFLNNSKKRHDEGYITMEMKNNLLTRVEIHFWNAFIHLIDESVFLQKTIKKAVNVMEDEKVNSFLAQLMVFCVVSLVIGFFWAVLSGLS
jgi:hypothetical protein